MGFTDDSIRFIDLRIKNSVVQELEGGHSDMVKAIKLSDDGMVCLSASSDATLRLWDIGQQKCINVYQNVQKKKPA
jgi:WD repeat-containing protein 48